MAELTLYGLKTCDTCRKVLKALESAGHSTTYVDVRADGVPASIIGDWLEEHGDALINTRSTTWRGLDEAERARLKGGAAGLLAEYPTLIKRPVIVSGDNVTVGWTKAVQASFGL